MFHETHRPLRRDGDVADGRGVMRSSRIGMTGGASGRPWCGGVGGDEETRTPDPLLAKEMLFRLSYVPSRVRAWDGRLGVGA